MLVPALQEVTRSVASDGQTTKWLWELADGSRVETVLMLYPGRATVCISSQAGCAMGCSFCATGQGGFARQLSRRGDRRAGRRRSPRRPPPPPRQRRVHGHGRAAGQLRPDVAGGRSECMPTWASRPGASRVSTVGVVPGIRRLAAEALPVNLAVSLHAARDELRNQIVPLNRRYPLSRC